MKPYYEQDGITIYHGDCREILPSVRADVAITDPPYGVGFSYAAYDDGRANYCKLMAEAVDLLLTRGHPVVLTPGVRFIHAYPPADAYWYWYKPGSVTRTDGGTLNELEPILVWGKLPDTARHASDVIRITSVANLTVGAQFGQRLCPKPVQLMVALAQRFPGDIVDPFTGTGTTLRAARDLGRRAIGIEIEERYCEIAARRLDQGVLDLRGSA